MRSPVQHADRQAHCPSAPRSRSAPAYPLPEERTMVLRGRNLVNGLPEAVEVSSIELRERLTPRWASSH